MSPWKAPLAAALICVAQAGLGSDKDLATLYVERQDGSVVSLSLEQLDALEQVEFSTSTIWTDGEDFYSGVPVLRVLEHAEADGSKLRMVALNEYSIEMPVDELDREYPIVATRINGNTISIRDKGPFWVMYPFDAAPEFATETNRSRSVWQLSQLVVIK